MASEKIAHIDKLGLVDSGLVDRKTGRKIVVPAQTKVVHDGRRVTKVIQSTQSIPTTFANGTSETRFVFDSSAVDSCRDLIFRFRVSVSSATSRLLPTAYWFNRIELHYRGSGSSYIQRWFPETLWGFSGMKPPSDAITLARDVNTNSQTLWAGEPHGVGVSKYYHLQLPMFYQSGLHFDSKLDGGGTALEFKFFGSGGIVASGGGTVSIDNVDMLVDSDLPLDTDKAAHLSVIRSHVQAGVFLDPVQLLQSSQSLSASTQYEFSLEQFSGRCAGFLLAIGASAGATSAAANYAVMNYMSLDGSGSGAGTIDVVSASGEALTTGGAPFQAAYWRQYLGVKWFNHQFLRNTNIYPIIFCRDLQATAFHGVVDDYLMTDGSQYRLRIVTPALGTSEVQTITQSGTPASGTYRLGWQDTVSGLISWTADLAYNTSAANMKVAFEALESVIQSKLLVTFSAAASAGAAFTATFTNYAGQAIDLGGNLIQMISQTATSAPANVGINSIARTTIGVPGWTNGTYNVNIIGLMIKLGKKSGGGFIAVDQL